MEKTTSCSSPILSIFDRLCHRVSTRAFRTSSALEARILASDPIEAICGEMLKKRNHELVALDKTPSAADLIKMIPEFDGLIVRRCVMRGACVCDVCHAL